MTVIFGQWREVPPPDEVPVYPDSTALGLLSCLRVYPDYDQFRCCECQGMQPAGSHMVQVPDIVQVGDPEWSITETSRRYAHNGDYFGWCLNCARSLTPKPKPWWRKLFSWTQR